jgi:glycosyltransferase involved in cell wall biosynthesis
MVLSDIRGCREIGRHGEQLLLVPPRDPVALASAIDRLLGDESLRDSLGAAARGRALAEFDQRHIALASLDAYVAAANRKGLGWTVGEVTGAQGR